MDIISLLTVTLRHAGPIILVAMGGLLAAKVNVFNLALEGFMLIGSFAAIVGAYYSNNVWVGVLSGVAASTLLIAIYAVFIIELKVQPVICAISIITLASGLTRYLLNPIFGVSGRYVLPSSLAMPTVNMAWLSDIPILGRIFNGHSLIVYFALALPFILNFVIYKTNLGLNLRAVGLNEEAAVAAGINVRRTQYLALTTNGVLCGLGGAELALSVYMFNVGMSNGRGYTALAAITLADNHPLIALAACLLFGFAESLVVSLSGTGFSSYLLGMIPYLLALLAAVLPQIIKLCSHSLKRKKAEKRMIAEYYQRQNV
ncbi:MAG: ABC transporter permease [Candidatus Pelethousia sp.]|nr:ABC transporter permease [Candidatus Pelethousia sp.]